MTYLRSCCGWWMALSLATAAEPAMDQLWGEQGVKLTAATAQRGQLLKEGHFAMFIHWGLYSQLANRWHGTTYYGIGEWILRMAKIPVADYVPLAQDFNPTAFDADAIAQLAFDAGMKYIVITSKHHEGFAMYHSRASAFNIVDATPFKRDPMHELAEACHRRGLGFGFYYSHFQDWTTPGAGGGPTTDAQGNPVDFAHYFRTKCLPQVEEITTGYGPIDIVWFDTPGSLAKSYAEELVATVHRNQPKALVSGRVGHNLGDYTTLGDMEVPLRNIPGLWESVDTTNDSWAYAWYDAYWKSPREILHRMLATHARGGTYMLNIGLQGNGALPGCAPHLRAVGQWIRRYPFAVYGTEASPWEHAHPWGDAVTHGHVVYALVHDWPRDEVLRFWGLKTPIVTAEVLGGAQPMTVPVTQDGGWTTLAVPARRPDPLVSVIRLTLAGPPQADSAFAVEPTYPLTIAAEFATGTGVTIERASWMEKFGEWKRVTLAQQWQPGGSVTWEVEVYAPGAWRADLTYAGKGRTVWKIATDTGDSVQNQQNGSAVLHRYPFGELTFPTAGRHRITVTLIEGDAHDTKLSALHLDPQF